MTKHEDYLWDGSGQPDADLERLERTLSELRYTRPAPEFPAPVGVIRPGRLRWWAPRLALAASLALVAFGAWYYTRPRPAWDVEVLSGAPSVGTKKLEQKASRLPVGDVLETDAESRVEISDAMVGVVTVEPNTRVRLVRAEEAHQRLGLERGTIHALIWAPPRLFVVETPSALAVDLGCKYTLTVDPDGAGHIFVERSWVAFELKGREAYVLEGARCSTRPGVGPGTPYYDDAPAAMREALRKLDFELLALGGGVEGGVAGGVAGGVKGGVEGGIEGLKRKRAEALATVLTLAREKDSFTLWHLLARVSEEERPGVYDRLAAYLPPPEGVTRAGVLQGDRGMLMLWWEKLTGKPPEWWQMWKSDPFVKK